MNPYSLLRPTVGSGLLTKQHVPAVCLPCALILGSLRLSLDQSGRRQLPSSH